MLPARLRCCRFVLVYCCRFHDGILASLCRSVKRFTFVSVSLPIPNYYLQITLAHTASLTTFTPVSRNPKPHTNPTQLPQNEQKLHLSRRQQILYLHPSPSVYSLLKAGRFPPLRQANFFHADFCKSFRCTDAQILFRHWNMPACSFFQRASDAFGLSLVSPSPINPKKP